MRCGSTYNIFILVGYGDRNCRHDDRNPAPEITTKGFMSDYECTDIAEKSEEGHEGLLMREEQELVPVRTRVA